MSPSYQNIKIPRTLGVSGFGVDRHCAYCLKFIPSKEVNVCGKCQRRAYCSKECEARDRAPKYDSDSCVTKSTADWWRGQGHGHWCDVFHGCCEEDIDWELTSMSGRGVVVFAKRDIPIMSRIMVDGLDPNPMQFQTSGAQPLKSLPRCNLISHSCDANAAKLTDPDYQVMVIYAKRDILAGEEITLNYIDFTETYKPLQNCYGIGSEKFVESFEQRRKILLMKWGIICQFDCSCKDPKYEKLIMKTRDRLENLNMLKSPRKKSALGSLLMSRLQWDLREDLEVLRGILRKHEKRGFSAFGKVLLLGTMFEVLMQKERNLEKAKEVIQEATEILGKITHPNSQWAKAHKYKKDPNFYSIFVIG